MSLSLTLAEKMRPNKLDDIVGQEHLIGKDGIIRAMVRLDKLQSFVLYGSPGIGKTTIAKVVANELSCEFVAINAGMDDKKALTDAIKKCSNPDKPGVIFIDEIHRLDKTKQDYLLSEMETGCVRVIGATTDNPMINLRPAVRSRMQIFELNRLSSSDIVTALRKAAEHYSMRFDEVSLQKIAEYANGDLRFAYNLLDLADCSAGCNGGGITVELIDRLSRDKILRRNIEGDSDGNAHYDLISALQKSIRGSDVDAALYYLACVLKTGDLPILIRRLTVILYEDIGLANPKIFAPVIQAIQSAKDLGLPEARIPLAVAVSMMSLSAKSNEAYKAIAVAMSDVESVPLDVPKHLRDAHYKGSDLLGSGVGYVYPHDYPYHIAKQQYLPDMLKYRNYLDLTNFKDDNGENHLGERLDSIRNFLREVQQ